MCLQPVNGYQGAAIEQEPCNGTVVQQWTQEVSPYDDNADWYVNDSSHLCLDVRGGDSNGVPIEQWTCDNVSDERWSVGVGQTMAKMQLYSLVAGHFDKCISTPGLVSGDKMVLYAGTPPTPSEWWNLTAI